MKRKNTLENITKELKNTHNVDYLDEKLSLSSYKWFTQYVRKHLYSINTVNKLKQLEETKQIKLQDVRRKNRKTLINDGNLYVFNYNPKTAEKLEFYDITPCVFVIDVLPDGFLGLNLHYLPPSERNRLLYFIKQSSKQGNFLSLIQQIKQKYPYYNKIIKRYLYTHIITNIHMIENKYYPLVANLPLGKFMKEDIKSVYRDTLSKNNSKNV